MLDVVAFALQVEVQRRLVADILLSLLADPITTDRRSPRYIPRQLIQPTPNAEVALWWDKPTLTFDDPTDALFTVQLQGGVRQPETERILTVNGAAHARLRLQVMSDADRTPHLGMSFVSLDLTKLTLTYASEPLDAQSSGDLSGPTPADVRRENGPLWRLVNESLITPLTRLPLSPAWGILTDWKAQGLRLGDAAAGALDGEVAAFRLASARTPQGQHAPPLGGQPFLDDRSDMALTLSADGLTQIAARLLDNGALPRRLRGERGDDLAQVEAIGFTFRDAVATLTAQMNHTDAQGDLEASVATDLSFEIDNRSALLITPIGQRISFRTQINAPGMNMRYQAAEQALSAAGRILATEFGLALPGVFGQPKPTGPLDHPQLPQRATLPSTSLQRELHPTRVVITKEALTILCNVSLADARFAPTPPARQPRVAIRRRPTHARTTIPLAQGATFEATLVAQSYEPYDFFWTTEIGQPLGEHTAAITIPAPRATGPRGAQTAPMQARVAVIDGFGQVAREAVPLRLATPGLAGVTPGPIASPTPLPISMPLAPATDAGEYTTPPPLSLVPSGFADDAEYQAFTPSVYSGAIGYGEDDTDAHPVISLDSQQREVIVLPSQRKRQRRMTSALALLLLLALLIGGVGAFLLLNHADGGNNPISAGAGIVHGIFGGATNTPGIGATATGGPGNTPAPGTTTTPNPKATHTPTGVPTGTPTGTVTPGPLPTPTDTPPPGSTPTPTPQPGTPPPTPAPGDPNVSANPSGTSQRCTLSGVSSFSVVITNSGHTTVNWVIVINQNAPNTSTPWASVSPSSGSSLTEGSRVTLTITPTSQDCSLLSQQTYSFTIFVTNADGSGNPQQVVFDDQVLPVL